MKIICIVVLFSFLPANRAIAQNDTYTLTVNVAGFENDKGQVLVSLETPDKKMVTGKKAGIKNQKAQIIFESVPRGKYAVRLFHDANNNQKMDTNFVGLPKENWGCSNNVKARFGPPKFDEMLFILDKTQTIAVQMQ